MVPPLLPAQALAYAVSSSLLSKQCVRSTFRIVYEDGVIDFSPFSIQSEGSSISPLALGTGEHCPHLFATSCYCGAVGLSVARTQLQAAIVSVRRIW